MSKFKQSKFIVSFFVLAFSAFMLSACVPAKTSKTTPEEAETEVMEETSGDMEGYKKYENKEAGVSIQYPKNWELEEGFMGTLAMFRSPLADANDKTQENVNIIVQDLSAQPVTMEQFTKISVEQIKQMIIGAEILEDNGKTTMLGQSATRVVYTGKQGQYDLKWMQVWTIKDEKAYIFTYTGGTDSYDDYMDQVKAMLKSMKEI